MDLETGAGGVMDAGEGDPATMAPGCAHSLAAIDFSRVMELSNTDVDYFEDTADYRFDNVPQD